MAPVTLPATNLPATSATPATPAAPMPTPASSGSSAAPSGDSFTREQWTFSPIRPQILGQNGTAPLWAAPGGMNGISTNPSPAPGPSAKPVVATPDPATTAYTQKLAGIVGATPDAIAKGQLPSGGPLSDAQKDQLVDATKDYLLDAKIGTLAGPLADQVKRGLSARGIDPKTVEGKSLKDLSEGVGDKIAGDVSGAVKSDPAAVGPLVAGGLAAAAGAAVAGANDRGLAVPKISGKIGPVTVSGQGSIEPGFKKWEATVDAKGSIPLKNGAAVDLRGSVSASDKGGGPSVDRAQGSATYRGPIGANGQVTATASGAVDQSGPSVSGAVTIQPKKGGPKIFVGSSADKNQQNVQGGVGFDF